MNNRGESKGKVVLVLGLILAIFSCIAAWIVVPEFRIITCGLFCSTPTPSRTLPVLGTNFQRYTDPERRFSLAVPADWVSAPEHQTLVRFVTPHKPFGSVIVRISQVQIDQLDDRFIEPGYGYYADEDDLFSLEKVLIGNREAYKQIYRGTFSDTSAAIVQRIYILEQGEVYTLSCQASPDDFPKLALLFEEIAGSFIIKP